MAPDVVGDLSHPLLEQLFHDRVEAQEEAKASLALSAEQMEWYYNQSHQETPFKVGDFVLLKGKDLKICAANTKLVAKNYGPYKITNQLGPTTFKLALPAKSQQHPVFHTSKFIWYHHNTIGKRRPTNLLPLQIEGHSKFEVESILDSKVHYQKVKYLVKWKGYDHLHDSWEPVSHVSNSKALVKKFHNNHPDAPKPILWTNPHPIATLFV
jgi:dipeptidase